MPFRRATLNEVIPGVSDTAAEPSSDASATPAVTPDRLREWVDHLHSPDAAVRSHALTRLQEHPDALASLAPSLLRADDPSVRITTLTALASTTHPDLEAWLIHVLDADADVNVCAAAIDLLGEVGTAASRQSLEALPDRFPMHPFIRFAVRVALERLTDE